MWRHLLAGGLDRQDERLKRGVDYLRSRRKSDGTWSKFPFWYTVLALSEMDFRDARQELAYATPLLQRAVERAPARSIYAKRRHELAVRALSTSTTL
jgi:hypothetical protein